jgi:hypothetical protein
MDKVMGRRSPKPQNSDAELLVLVRADLAASPFQGEGYRKVWARLRVQQQIRTAPKQILRIMRENQLLRSWRVAHAHDPRH